MSVKMHPKSVEKFFIYFLHTNHYKNNLTETTNL